MRSRLFFKHLASAICLFIGMRSTNALPDALITNRCAILLLHSPAIIRASLFRPVLQRSERIQIEGKAGSVPLEKISDIHAGLIQTQRQLEGIGLKVPTLTHVVLDPDSKFSPYAFPYRLIRLRQERLIYLNGNNSGYEHHNGIQRLIANHEMIHTSMLFAFPYSARVNESGLYREAFANFLSFHFDPETYRKEGAFHETNLEYNNESNMGAAVQGRERTLFFTPTVWGNDHKDGLLLGHLLLRIRKVIGREEMDHFLRELIPALNRFSVPASIRADIEFSGEDRTSWGKVVINHNHDLLLALALVDRLGRRWPSIQTLVAEFCAATETKLSLERLREIEGQLLRSR